MKAEWARIRRLLAQSVALEVLAEVFRSSRDQRRARLPALAAEARDSLRGPLGELVCALAAAEGPESGLVGATGSCHDSELAYRPTEPAGTVLSDIAGFYEAFGYGRELYRGEPLDHVSTQLAFLAFLCAKEACARSEGKRQAARLCEQARLNLVADHLGLWLPSFAEALAGRAPSSPWARAAALARDAIERWSGGGRRAPGPSVPVVGFEGTDAVCPAARNAGEQV